MNKTNLSEIWTYCFEKKKCQSGIEPKQIRKTVKKRRKKKEVTTTECLPDEYPAP